MPYKRRSDAAQLVKLIRGIEGAEAGRWSIAVAERVAATANARFNDNENPRCWRNRYTSARRTLNTDVGLLRHLIEVAMKRQGYRTREDLAEQLKLLNGPTLTNRIRGTTPWGPGELAEVEVALKMRPGTLTNGRGDKEQLALPPAAAPAEPEAPAPEQQRIWSPPMVIGDDRIACAVALLHEQWERFTSTGKWCDPYRIHTALQVLEGNAAPFKVERQ